MADPAPTDKASQMPDRAVPVAELARLLGCEEVAIRADLDAGAPANPDGTINLLHYAAWLNVQLRGRAEKSSNGKEA